jgi:hypothetical protein
VGKVRLTRRERSELCELARSSYPLWGGVAERGGDLDVDRWERAGLIRRVNRRYRLGKSTYTSGYEITPLGRALLSEQEARDE